MQCIKATGEYGGRTYIAWFTEEYPISFGPWKLHGLPGAIIQVYDTNKEIQFQLKHLKKQSIEVKLDFLKERTITLKAYYQREIDYPDELVKKFQAMGNRGSSITISGRNYNFLEKNFEYLSKNKN